jgi:lysophospholipid acyltransferase (LPLAT)-like uncharacterized protein
MPPRDPDTAAALPRASVRRRRVRTLATSGLALALGRGLVRGLGASLRVRERRAPAIDMLWARESPMIYVVWHGRILMLPYLYRRRRRLTVLASRSRDGEILARFVEGFGLAVVRGSSSHGGGPALLALARRVRRQAAEVVIVPDGPRGPREVAQPGAAMLARLTGAPVVPVGFGAWPRTILRTWDAFMVPRPFARAAVVMGEPIVVAPRADAGAIEGARQAIEAAMRRVTAEADRAARERHVPAL